VEHSGESLFNSVKREAETVLAINHKSDIVQQIGSRSTGSTVASSEQQREVVSDSSRESVVSFKHLQSFVANFAKKAVRGQACVHFDTKTGKRTPAIYRLSEDLAEFSIEAEKRGLLSRFSLKCAVAAIKDIDDSGDYGSLLKPKARATITQEDEERFLTVFYEGKRGDIEVFCLLEESHEQRNVFVNGLKTLASTMQT